MIRWSQAHAIARIAAVHAHEEAAVDRHKYVDIFAALESLRVPVMYQWMPRLFGAYYSPKAYGPGILLNSGLPYPTLRHTAAHELGHHVMVHGTVVDSNLGEETGFAWDRAGWSDQEMIAEAFAAWFLMPLPAVRAAVSRLPRQEVAGPEDAYTLALQLGCTYRGLIRHLVGLRMIKAKDAHAWARVSLDRVRKGLLPAWSSSPLPARCDVWRLTQAHDGMSLRVGPKDLIIAEFPTSQNIRVEVAGGQDSIEVEEKTAGVGDPNPIAGALVRLSDRLSTVITISAGTTGVSAAGITWSMVLSPIERRTGIHAPWLYPGRTK